MMFGNKICILSAFFASVHGINLGTGDGSQGEDPGTIDDSQGEDLKEPAAVRPEIIIYVHNVYYLKWFLKIQNSN